MPTHIHIVSLSATGEISSVRVPIRQSLPSCHVNQRVDLTILFLSYLLNPTVLATFCKESFRPALAAKRVNLKLKSAPVAGSKLFSWVPW